MSLSRLSRESSSYESVYRNQLLSSCSVSRLCAGCGKVVSEVTPCDATDLLRQMLVSFMSFIVHAHTSTLIHPMG